MAHQNDQMHRDINERNAEIHRQNLEGQLTAKLDHGADSTETRRRSIITVIADSV